MNNVQYLNVSFIIGFVILQTLLVRWEPPPVTDQNGVITGYKLRFKKDGDRKGMATTVDANQRSYALKGEYSCLLPSVHHCIMLGEDSLY